MFRPYLSHTSYKNPEDVFKNISCQRCHINGQELAMNLAMWGQVCPSPAGKSYHISAEVEVNYKYGVVM